MDEDVEEQLAPLVDALTGAMAAVLLISIFMMINTMTNVAQTIKEYGQQALYENQTKLGDVFGRKPPEIQFESKRIYFFKSFKMTEEQITTLSEYFKENPPKKFTMYSDEAGTVSTFNLLSFLSDVGLSDKLDEIEIAIEEAKQKSVSEFTWE